MEVRVRLYGALRRYRPEGAPEAGPFPLDLPEGTTVAGALEHLGAPADWARSAFVNEELSPRDRVLCPGDLLALFPPAGGGEGEGIGVWGKRAQTALQDVWPTGATASECLPPRGWRMCSSARKLHLADGVRVFTARSADHEGAEEGR